MSLDSQERENWTAWKVETERSQEMIVDGRKSENLTVLEDKTGRSQEFFSTS